MAFDYKKAYKDLYLPPRQPQIITVPPMNFLAVRGAGDPNAEGGDYQAAMGLLYGVAFTIKMSKLGSHAIDGYFDYVVPPLEGLWWQEGQTGLDLTRKETLCWISLIRLPEFVTPEVFRWAVQEAAAKKHADFSAVEFFPYAEGPCVQCLHVGPYDTEGETLRAMDAFAAAQGYLLDCGSGRYHHEIYLGDPRRCKPENLKTVLRHPVQKSKQ